ncbi:MAG: type I restriction-modification enzyme R subunit C-terminal domain-containing protein [Nocardioidaceae bacterium]
MPRTRTQSRQQLIIDAVKPLAANPDLRNRILELRAAHDRVIDEVSADVLLDAYGVVDTSKATSVVESWRAYLDEHRAEITAIQLLTEAERTRGSPSATSRSSPTASRDRPTTGRPTSSGTPTSPSTPQYAARPDHHTLTDLVSLVRFTVGADDELVPYAERVQEKYAAWLAQQEQAGVTFTDAERWWLDSMVQVIATLRRHHAPTTSTTPPSSSDGGTDGALRDLGDRAATLDPRTQQGPDRMTLARRPADRGC